MVVKEFPLYINFIVFKVIASYSKFELYPVRHDLNLTIVTAKPGQICKKAISVTYRVSVPANIQSKYGQIQTRKNSIFGHFSRSDKLS